MVVASSRSTVAGPPVEHFDKVAHFSVYGRAGLRAVVLVSLFGASDEVHQYFTPGRSMEFADWVADTLGATVAVAGYAGWTAYRERLEAPVWRRAGR